MLTPLFFRTALITSALLLANTASPQTIPAKAPSRGIVIVKASGTLAANLGPKFELRINGDSYGLTEVRSTTVRDYRFVLHTPLPATAKFELIYRNDYERDGQKRSLFIDSITINGASISATAQGVVFDRGSGAQAFDNLDVQPGQSTLTSNGALRFTYAPKVAVPPIVGVTPPPAVTPPTPATPPVALTPTSLFNHADYRAGLAMWRAPRTKGACMSCHGPDFFDLARTGALDVDLRRRALNDGTSNAEAQALVTAVGLVRAAHKLPAENPRQFRPLQPGGALLAGSSNIERDLAFASELARFMPTLTSTTRIDSLSAAKRARDEFLAIDFAQLKIGIPFPLWSADRFHDAREGTLNDWVADLSREPKPEQKAAWIVLQDTYLADPSDANFWRLYFAVGDLTQAATSINPTDPGDRVKAERFTELKFRSALIGQHALRTAALGRNDFMRGQVPFSYLAAQEPWRTTFANKSASGVLDERIPKFLPNPMWEVGDTTRKGFETGAGAKGQLGSIGSADLMVDRLRLLGYPQFVLESVDPTVKADAQSADLRLAWFMLGVRFDPSLQRISQSNATLVGEYLQTDLSSQDYFIHRVFQEGLREVTRSYRPEASLGTSPAFNLYYAYFSMYNRHLPSRWNSADNASVSADLKNRQLAAYKRITANFFRMCLYLHEEALDSGKIAPYGTSTKDGAYQNIQDFFNYADQPERNADDALLRRVAAKSNTPLNF